MDAFWDINCQCGIFSTPSTNFGILLLLFQALNPRDEISFFFVDIHSTIWTNFGIRLLLFQVLNPKYEISISFVDIQMIELKIGFVMLYFSFYQVNCSWNKGCIGC